MQELNAYYQWKKYCNPSLLIFDLSHTNQKINPRMNVVAVFLKSKALVKYFSWPKPHREGNCALAKSIRFESKDQWQYWLARCCRSESEFEGFRYFRTEEKSYL